MAVESTSRQTGSQAIAGKPKRRMAAASAAGKTAKTGRSKTAAGKIAKTAAGGRGASKKAKRKRAPVSAATVRVLAMDTKSMAEADEQIDLAIPLVDLLKKFPRLKQAWERGRFLRSLRGLAASAASIAEAGHAMNMAEERMREILDTDAEARDVWNQARITTTIAVKAGMVRAAQEGKTAAVNSVLASLRREIAKPRIDFSRLTVSQTEVATGYSRQTLHAWAKDRDAPRNADGTFDLPSLWGWFEKHVSRRTAAPSQKNAFVNDPLKRAKAEKLSRELDMQKGQLLVRDEVVAGLVARHQVLVTAMARRPAELAIVLQGQTQARIVETLDQFFTDLRRRMLDVPESLRLSPRAKKMFLDLLETMDREGA